MQPYKKQIFVFDIKNKAIFKQQLTNFVEKLGDLRPWSQQKVLELIQISTKKQLILLASFIFDYWPKDQIELVSEKTKDYLIFTLFKND